MKCVLLLSWLWQSVGDVVEGFFFCLRRSTKLQNQKVFSPVRFLCPLLCIFVSIRNCVCVCVSKRVYVRAFTCWCPHCFFCTTECLFVLMCPLVCPPFVRVFVCFTACVSSAFWWSQLHNIPLCCWEQQQIVKLVSYCDDCSINLSAHTVFLRAAHCSLSCARAALVGP